jgi:hypothetical protein
VLSQNVCVTPHSFPDVVYVGECGGRVSITVGQSGDHWVGAFVCVQKAVAPGVPNVPTCYEILVWMP